MYRSAFLGCGPRARGHAAAYEHVTRGRISAICDLNTERLNGFGDTFGVPARYTDFPAMIAAEKPDVLHLVTLPALRVELLTQAVELGIPAVIVEKPLACDLDELAAIERLEGRGTKIVVNHQLRFHQRFQELLADVTSGRIGTVRFIDGSCFSKPSEQGSHLMNLMFALNSDSPATLVQGNCGGAAGLDGGSSKHPAPDHGWSILTFANGVRASYVCGAGAPQNGQPSIWMQKRVAAYGDAGHVSWSMVDWSKQLYGQGPLRGVVEYGPEDTVGQGLLTEAVFDWLADEQKPHATRLEISLLEARAIFALYASTLAQGPVELPLASTAALLPQLREVLRP